MANTTMDVGKATPVRAAVDRAKVGWPRLPLSEWRDTYQTLHRWTQVVGKIQLALADPANHWWHVTQHVTARGLTTGPLPLHALTVQIDFDFVDHVLLFETSEGAIERIPLGPRSVADMYGEIVAALAKLGCDLHIWTTPVEMPDPVPFEKDWQHHSYDPAAVMRFHRALVQVDRVFRKFRGEFLGKSSPVHFFWGAFDLAVTRFSGRFAPAHPPVPGVSDRIVREAYSHECSSAGFWPGDERCPEAAFYSYAYPEPPGYSNWPVVPAEVRYRPDMGEYILPYEAVRTSADPEATLLAFLHSGYEAAAVLGAWDRARLERV